MPSQKNREEKRRKKEKWRKKKREKREKRGEDTKMRLAEQLKQRDEFSDYKKELYPDLNRYIFDYQITNTGDGINLNVVSSLEPPDRRSD